MVETFGAIDPPARKLPANVEQLFYWQALRRGVLTAGRVVLTGIGFRQQYISI